MADRYLALGPLAAAVALTAASGCGNAGPPMGSVSGVVTMADGLPVAEAQIAFVPDEPGVRAATGVTEADGSYRLSTFDPGDGAVVGKYRVTVAKVGPYEGQIPPGMGGAYEEMMEARGEPLLPVRYFQTRTSGLTAEVGPGDNRFDFTLERNAATGRR